MTSTAKTTSSEKSGKTFRRRPDYRPVVVLLTIHALLVAWGATCLSPTWDEAGHLAAGVAHWRHGRFDVYNVNPPLPRLMATTAILLTDFDLQWKFGKDTDNPWRRSNTKNKLGRQIIRKYGADSMWYFIIVRWMSIPFSLWGGWICYAWGRDLFGPASGLVALALWCFSPSILGNAMLFTTDIPAAAAAMAAAYAFWRWQRTPNSFRAFAAGALLGVALLCKMSLIILIPAWGIWGAWYCIPRSARNRSRAGQLLGIVALALLVVNLGYGFEGSFRSLGSYDFYSRALTGVVAERPGHVAGNRFQDSALGRIPVPLPAQYVIGIDTQKTYFDRGQPVFLNGVWCDRGFHSYYLFCMLYKWPLGTLALLAITCFAMVGLRRYRASLRDELFLFYPALLILLLVSLNTSINKHIRYVLPAFPFLFIGIGRLARGLEFRDKWLTAAMTAGLSATIVASLSMYPHSLSFFNVATGGPMRGDRLLAGTAVDWGQDLNYLSHWLDAHPEASPIGIEYGGLYKVRDYGFLYHAIAEGPSTDPEDRRGPDEIGPLPGWYAISLRSLNQRESPYTYFKSFDPQGRAGYSMRIYHITEQESNRVRAAMGLPAVTAAHTEAEDDSSRE